jgi:hypothetical protein
MFGIPNLLCCYYEERSRWPRDSKHNHVVPNSDGRDVKRGGGQRPATTTRNAKPLMRTARSAAIRALSGQFTTRAVVSAAATAMAAISTHRRGKHSMATTLATTRDWESVFSTWAQGPSKTEQEKAENAERQIYQVIQNCEHLRNRDIRVFTQGSYRNRVNVRRESDVDIGVLCLDTYFSAYPDDNVKALAKRYQEPATYTYEQFKNELQRALVDRFGAAHVTRGDKAFQVDENTYRVNADVAAFFEHRRYFDVTRYHSGVQMLSDKGRSVINWPEQHYRNGVDKNSATGRRYKRAVRILKTLRNELAEKGVRAAEPIPSFLVECLVWNAPESVFDFGSYRSMMRAVLAELFNYTLRDDQCSEWGEVSELKYLFRSVQPWTRQQAHDFLDAAWDYVGYE